MNSILLFEQLERLGTIFITDKESNEYMIITDNRNQVLSILHRYNIPNEYCINKDLMIEIDFKL